MVNPSATTSITLLSQQSSTPQVNNFVFPFNANIILPPLSELLLVWFTGIGWGGSGVSVTSNFAGLNAASITATSGFLDNTVILDGVATTFALTFPVAFADGQKLKLLSNTAVSAAFSVVGSGDGSTINGVPSDDGSDYGLCVGVFDVEYHVVSVVLMKIAIYAVALNESKHVNRFMDACDGADWVFVADTGSTDNTVALLTERGAELAEIRVKPWRFDDARNALLALLPDDIDVCVSLDLDEVLQPGWRAEIERVWVPGTTRLRYGFDWGCGIVFQYEKIHCRHGYRWFGSCHEYPVADRITEKYAETDKLLVVHKPDPTKSRGQYLDLLRVSVEENPTEPRNAFYYARELSYAKRWHEAIAQAERYLALPRATWPNERCYAMRVMAKCYAELQQWAKSLEWARRACSEAEHTREPWCELAEICQWTQRWSEMFGAAMTALYIVKREKLYTVDPSVWGAKPHDLVSISAYYLGMYDIALEHARKAVELSPDDLRLRQNLKFCEEKAA